MAGRGLGGGDLTGIEVLAQMVGVALAPWARLVALAIPAAFGTASRTWVASSAFGASCRASGGGADGKPCRCSADLNVALAQVLVDVWEVGRRRVDGEVENGT